MGTGGGTDHDDESIRARPAFKWEGVFEDPIYKLRLFSERIRRRPLGKLAVWFGVTPVGRTRYWTNGVAFDLRLDKGRYVVLEAEPTGGIEEM